MSTSCFSSTSSSASGSTCARCKLNEFRSLLADAVQNFECACLPPNKDKKALVSYHVQEISNHLERARYHVDQMMVAQGKPAMIRNNNLPAEKIRHEIKLAEQKLRFKDKQLRKASSLKYITKWEEILEKHWAQQNRKEYNYEGVNIIDARPLKAKVYKSSDCILEGGKEEPVIPLAKSNSAGNLLETFDDGRDGNLRSEFLLSLKDLENIGRRCKLEQVNLETARSCGALNENRKSSQRKRSTGDVPRIIGVVYKMRL